MNNCCITVIYLFKGKILHTVLSFAFIAPVAGVLSAGLSCKTLKVYLVYRFVILSILVPLLLGTRWIDKLFPPMESLLLVWN